MKKEKIPEGWERIKLKEVLQEVNERNKNEKVKRVLSVTNSKGFVNQEEYFEGTVHSENISNYKIVKKNQFAYNPSRINVGSIDILEKYDEGALSPMYVVFRVDESRLLPEYFNYYFETYRFSENVKNNTQGSVRNSLNFSALADFEYLLPTIKEQQKIIDLLKKVDKSINLYEELIENKKQLIKARFVELFGDGRDGKTPVKMLGHICRFQQGTQIPVEEQFEEQKTGYKRFLRIIDYTQAPQPPRYVNVNGKEVDEKSVVIVRYGATAGFVGRGYQGILANNLFEIMPDETILSKEFLFLALKYGTFEKEVHDKAFGAAMPALSFSMMNDIPVVVPMAEEQKKFVSFVEQTDKSKILLEKQKENYIKLKKGLMQQLLTGKIRVKI